MPTHARLRAPHHPLNEESCFKSYANLPLPPPRPLSLFFVGGLQLCDSDNVLSFLGLPLKYSRTEKEQHQQKRDEAVEAAARKEQPNVGDDEVGMFEERSAALESKQVKSQRGQASKSSTAKAAAPTERKSAPVAQAEKKPSAAAAAAKPANLFDDDDDGDDLFKLAAGAKPTTAKKQSSAAPAAKSAAPKKASVPETAVPAASAAAPEKVDGDG